MRHLVLISFNGGNSDYSWLAHRMQFFRAFTLPSLLNQTNTNFKVVFSVDPSTPVNICKELDAVGLVYFTESGPRHNIREAPYREFLSDELGDETWVLTTRLDSDDAISKTYVEHVQRVAKPETGDLNNEFIIYNNGVTWFEDRFYLKTFVAAQFISYSEFRHKVPAPPRTVFGAKTHQTALELPNQQHNGPPMWLMACHDRNLLNVPGELGRELSLEEVQEHFEVDLSWLE